MTKGNYTVPGKCNIHEAEMDAIPDSARRRSGAQTKTGESGGGARRAGPQRLSSVATAVKLLKTFSAGEAEIGVTTLAKRLGVAKSAVYQLASTLVAEGMLERCARTRNTGWASRCWPRRAGASAHERLQRGAAAHFCAARRDQ